MGIARGIENEFNPRRWHQENSVKPSVKLKSMQYIPQLPSAGCILKSTAIIGLEAPLMSPQSSSFSVLMVLTIQELSCGSVAVNSEIKPFHRNRECIYFPVTV